MAKRINLIRPKNTLLMAIESFRCCQCAMDSIVSLRLHEGIYGCIDRHQGFISIEKPTRGLIQRLQ